jgi:diaminopimelate epimerase
MISFRKMHGLGNDFVILDGRSEPIVLKKEEIIALSDRRRGVGCDQVIVMEPARQADVFMRIYNPDGSEAGACGNATRCVADIVMTEKGAEICVIETVSGLLHCCRAAASSVTVDMGAPGLSWDAIPLSKTCDTLHLPLPGDPVGVSMGNPHCIFFVDDAEEADVPGIGSRVEKDPLFPGRTNVEFVQIIDRSHIRMRVWERGAGITQACGTGACAAAVAAMRRGLTDRLVTVVLDDDRSGDLCF